MDGSRLWPLEGAVRRYAWGSLTSIPEFLGKPPDGEPQAELWLGAHARGPATLRIGSQRVALNEWIDARPEQALGERAAARFDGRLPYLLKILAAAQPLSIQAHPNREQARAGFARESAAGIPVDADHRNYRDPHHKPELICALSPFRALNRFRPPAEIERRISALGVPGFGPIVAPLREAPNRAGVRAFFERWMSQGQEASRRLLAEAVAAARRAPPSADPALAEVVRLAEAYPGDPGALAPLFLNWVELAPGEAMYLPAGELHSYLGGTGIELMANSDNVLRGGLTDKHVDRAELLATLTFEAGPVERLLPRPVDDVEARYATPAEEFSLARLQLRPGSRWTAARDRSAEIALCAEGEARAIDAQGNALALARGAALFAPAAAGRYAIEGDGAVFVAGVGQPG